jgi:hypothetical protein
MESIEYPKDTHQFALAMDAAITTQDFETVMKLVLAFFSIHGTSMEVLKEPEGTSVGYGLNFLRTHDYEIGVGYFEDYGDQVAIKFPDSLECLHSNFTEETSTPQGQTIH